MKAIRQILSDRILATALAAVIAYVLALQGFAGGYARASVITPADSALHVICASSGIADEASRSTQDPLRKSADCPCATLCRLAGSMAPAILPVLTAAIRLPIVTSSTVAPASSSSLHLPQRGLVAEPRGPPARA